MTSSRLEEALELLELDPKNSLLLLAVGRFYNELKEWDKAEDYLTQSIDAKPGSVLPYRDLGATYEGLGNKEKALEIYEKGRQVAAEVQDGTAEADFALKIKTLGV